MKAFFALVAFCALSLTSCKDDEPGVEPYTPKVVITGFTFTDIKGAVLSADTNDWRETSLIKAPRLFPNPIEEGDSARFEFTLEELADCSVRIVTPEDSSTIIHKGVLSAGAHLWSIKGLKAGSYRLYVTAGHDSSYGDISVVRIGTAN